MSKLYAKHIGTGAWHQVLDVVDSKIPAHMPGGGNMYHLDGHKEPVHQDKIEDLAHEGDDHLTKTDTHKYEKKVTDPDTGRERTVKYGHKDYKIAPSTKKGDSYCARSMRQMKDGPKAAKDPNSPLRLSRKKWKCSGSKSLRKSESLIKSIDYSKLNQSIKNKNAEQALNEALKDNGQDESGIGQVITDDRLLLSTDHVSKILNHIQKQQKHSPHYGAESIAALADPYSHNSSKINDKSLDRMESLVSGDYERNLILSHPKYIDKLPHLKHVGKFWNSYEKNVHPDHFAVIASHMSGKPEEFKNYRPEQHKQDMAEIGYSHGNNVLNGTNIVTSQEAEDLGWEPHQHIKYSAHVLPHLQEHANIIQEQILNDKNIPKKMIKGVPHIELHRGVHGEYAQQLWENATDNNGKIKKGSVGIRNLPFSSWTTDKEIAHRFAGKNRSENAVISKWTPISDILHSGFHRSHPLQQHSHIDESEIVVKHLEPISKIKTSNIHGNSETHRVDQDLGDDHLTKSFHPSQDKILADNQDSTQKVKMPSLETEHPDYTNWQKIAKSPGMANHLSPNQKEESAYGLSPKVVHFGDESEPNQKYMVKPYFSKPTKNESTQHDLPIKGWATATTRDLFDAADVSHLCENVHVSEHKGQPVTIHKFGLGMPYPPSTDHKINRHMHNRNINKIAMLDYLTGNQASGFNILNGLYSESNKRMPLAIDHDLNFRYIDRNNGRDHSKVQSHGYGFKNRIMNAEPDGTASSDAQFILNNHESLAEAFNKKLEEINDPHLKSHLNENFHGRLNHLKNWANQRTPQSYLNDEDSFKDDSFIANLAKEAK